MAAGKALLFLLLIFSGEKRFHISHRRSRFYFKTLLCSILIAGMDGKIFLEMWSGVVCMYAMFTYATFYCSVYVESLEELFVSHRSYALL